MTINNSMLVKGALQSAASEARKRFNSANGADAVEKNKKLRATLTDFLERTALAQRENGEKAFETKFSEYTLGHVLILHVNGNEQLNIEFNISDHDPQYSVQINEQKKMDNEYFYRTSEMEAILAVASWAGRTAPDVQQDLNGIIEQFFWDKNIVEGTALDA